MTAQAALTDAVFAATTLGPRIVRGTTKAKHAAPSEALARVREARQLLRQLGDKLALAEAAIVSEGARPLLDEPAGR
jgi:hypothetical protein